jgi:hypothetical protein
VSRGRRERALVLSSMGSFMVLSMSKAQAHKRKQTGKVPTLLEQHTVWCGRHNSPSTVGSGPSFSHEFIWALLAWGRLPKSAAGQTKWPSEATSHETWPWLIRFGWNSETFHYQHRGQAPTPARLTSAFSHPPTNNYAFRSPKQTLLWVTLGSDMLFSDGN